MRTLSSITETCYQLRIIGIDDYIERRKVFRWIGDKTGTVSDPRLPKNIELEKETPEADDIENLNLNKSNLPGQRSDAPDFIHFLYKKWIFTRSDRDSYPSTPHGHFQNPNLGWPKLNPYTGRAFKEKHQEEVMLRMSKKDMKDLWNDPAFREFCRSYIGWYLEEFPFYRYPTLHPLRFPKW